MIPGILKIFIAIVLIAAAIVGFSNKRPPTAAKKQTVATNYFYYFPKANVYFDSVSKEYTYLLQNNQDWHTDANIPDSIRFLMNKKVVLGKVRNPVWKNNEHDRLVYSVALYATAEDFKEKPVPPPSPVKVSVPEKNEEQHHESGIKRFFKKLFKKLDS